MLRDEEVVKVNFKMKVAEVLGGEVLRLGIGYLDLCNIARRVWLDMMASAQIRGSTNTERHRYGVAQARGSIVLGKVFNLLDSLYCVCFTAISYLSHIVCIIMRRSEIRVTS